MSFLRQPRLRLLIPLVASVAATVFPVAGDAAPRPRGGPPAAKLGAPLRPRVSVLARSHRVILTWSIRGRRARGIAFRVYRNGRAIARTSRYAYTDRRVRDNVAYRYE